MGATEFLPLQRPQRQTRLRSSDWTVVINSLGRIQHGTQFNRFCREIDGHLKQYFFMSLINHVDINFFEKKREETSVLQQPSESDEAHSTCGSNTSPSSFQHKSNYSTKSSFTVESHLEVHKHNIFTHIQV